MQKRRKLVSWPLSAALCTAIVTLLITSAEARFVADGEPVTVELAKERNVVTCICGEICMGSSGDDEIRGSECSDFIIAGDGRDLIIAGPGDDFILAGTGDDRVLAGLGNDTVYSGDGHDSIDAGAGDDMVHAGRGDDAIAMGPGNDLAFGGDGDDMIRAGKSAPDDSSGAMPATCVSGSYTTYCDDDDDIVYGGSGIRPYFAWPRR